MMFCRAWLYGAALIAAGATAACGDDGGGGVDAALSVDGASAADAAPPADSRPIPDAYDPADARPPNLACLGQPLPTTAPSTITIAGNAFRPGIASIPDEPVAGAVIETFERGDETTVIANDTSDSAGDFSLTASTSDLPINGYLRATATNFWTTYLYPPTPVADDLSNVQVVMTTDTLVGLLQNLVGVTFDTSKGWVSLVVLDCDGRPIAGAEVSSTPAAGATAYSDGTGAPSAAVSSTNTDGVAMLFDVPVGSATLQASVGGQALRSHDVTVQPVADKKMITTAVLP